MILASSCCCGPIPFAPDAAFNCSRKRCISLAEAERRFVGMSSSEMAYRFALKNGLPQVYAEVARWSQTPEGPQGRISWPSSFSGSRPCPPQAPRGRLGRRALKGSIPFIEETSAWSLERVFPVSTSRSSKVPARGIGDELEQQIAWR